MKNQLLVLFTIIITLNSCSVIREKKTDSFFNNWERESRPISNNDYNNLAPLYKSTYDIFNLINCFSKTDIYITTKEYPRLKYQIVSNEIKVKIIKGEFTVSEYGISYNPFNTKDSILEIKPKANNSCLKYLYLSDKYKRKVLERSDLKYGLAYSSAKTEKSKKTGRAIIGKHHLSNHFSIGGITEIIFNKDIDSALVSERGTYTEMQSLYIYDKQYEKWKLEKELWNSIE